MSVLSILLLSPGLALQHTLPGKLLPENASHIENSKLPAFVEKDGQIPSPVKSVVEEDHVIGRTRSQSMVSCGPDLACNFKLKAHICANIFEQPESFSKNFAEATRLVNLGRIWTERNSGKGNSSWCISLPEAHDWMAQKGTDIPCHCQLFNPIGTETCQFIRYNMSLLRPPYSSIYVQNCFKNCFKDEFMSCETANIEMANPDRNLTLLSLDGTIQLVDELNSLPKIQMGNEYDKWEKFTMAQDDLGPHKWVGILAMSLLVAFVVLILGLWAYLSYTNETMRA
uniref:Folate receptor-like domain-containing protein n=1 Tax=Lotharella oceanica TaxID=641309 RepID=A0A7S2TW21_9EUKA